MASLMVNTVSLYGEHRSLYGEQCYYCVHFMVTLYSDTVTLYSDTMYSYTLYSGTVYTVL